jgi:hypothetical protein
MVLAQGKDVDIADNHHLVVILFKHGAIQDISRLVVMRSQTGRRTIYAHFVATGKKHLQNQPKAQISKHHGFGVAIGRLQEAFTQRIFANTLEERADGIRHFGQSLLLLIVVFIQTGAGTDA